MTKHLRTLRGFFVTATALTLTVASSAGWAQDDPEFSELRVLIEINASDGDAGFQAKVDGDGWKEVTIRDPDGKKLYNVRAFGSVLQQGLTENFFESAEPSCDDLPLADFLARFPEGEYVFTGKTTDGHKLEGEAILTHDLPGAPTDLAPSGDGVDAGNAVQITWAEGNDLGDCPPDGAFVGDPDIFGYQVVVAREMPEPLVEFIAELPATATQVTIPPEFLIADAVYKFEVLAIEARLNEDLEVERGNQTISEEFFCTFAATAENPCELPE